MAQMRPLTLASCLLAVLVPNPAPAQDAPRQVSGDHAVTLRLPPGGLVAGAEMQIEFRLEDLRESSPVRFARVRAVVDMPSMPSMARFDEIAHAEGVVGDYGFHPTFAHGGEYRVTLTLLPPDEQPITMSPRSTAPFTMQFTLSVQDAGAGLDQPRGLPRYGLNVRPVGPLVAGRPADLEILVTQRGVRIPLAEGRFTVGEGPVHEFDLVHERPLHLFLVRDDLGVFLHEHPDPGPAGVFRLRVTLPTGGRYRVFADVAPRNAGSQIVVHEIVVGGPPASVRFSLAVAAARQPRVVAQTVAGLRFRWQWPEPVPVRKTIPVTVTVESVGGGKGEELERYLGALGHLILVHEDGVTFVHSHPDELSTPPSGSTAIPFLARFPQAGLYRGWAQFQRGGRLVTVDFVVGVP
jgi:hypothetical protein